MVIKFSLPVWFDGTEMHVELRLSAAEVDMILGGTLLIVALLWVAIRILS